LGNNHGNFELHGFTRRENTAKYFRGATFLTHTVHRIDWCIDLFSCTAARLFNKLTYLLTMFTACFLRLHWCDLSFL